MTDPTPTPADVAAAKECADAAVSSIRGNCSACERGVFGVDADGSAIECEYCGRPIQHIDAAAFATIIARHMAPEREAAAVVADRLRQAILDNHTNQYRIRELKNDVNRLNQMCEEMDRFKAIVERLPKTADGVPIHPGLKVFSWNDGEIISNTVGDYTTYVAHGAGGDKVYARWGRESFPGMRFDARADNGFYSTRHAAEAAKEGA